MVRRATAIRATSENESESESENKNENGSEQACVDLGFQAHPNENESERGHTDRDVRASILRVLIGEIRVFTWF